jgi:alginate production protein
MMRGRGASLLPVAALLVCLCCGAPSAQTQSSRQGDDAPAFDPKAPPDTPTQIAPGLWFGGNIELEYEGRSIEFRETDTERPSVLEPELSLALSAQPRPGVLLYAELELAGELDVEAGTGGYRGTQGEFKEAFAQIDLGAGAQLTFGRQRYKDDREWLWDDELDGVALSYRAGPLKLEASLTRQDFLPLDFLQELADELTNNYFAGATWTVNNEVDLGAYVLARDDLTDRRDSPVFVGLRADGDLTRDIEFSLNLVALRGSNGAQKLRAFGGDIAATWEFTKFGRQAVTGAFAYGSGDRDSTDRVDEGFRQTGLQENEDKFHGVTRFKYYGAAFDPELSNLRIFTAGYSFRPTEKSSVDLVGHYYLQDVAAAEVRNAGLGVTPTGRSTRLGSELDLIIGFREWKNADLRVVFAAFIPDDALSPVIRTSYFAGVDLEVSF